MIMSDNFDGSVVSHAEMTGWSFCGHGRVKKQSNLTIGEEYDSNVSLNLI